jgi:N-acetylmuramoyl-L-alanine amidase
MTARGLLLSHTIPQAAQSRIVEGCLRGFANALPTYNESRQSPNYWDNPNRRRVRCVVWHITDGGFTASLDWLCNPQSQASANDVINRDGGVWNIVPGRLAPWTNGPLCKPNKAFAIPDQAAATGTNPNWWSYTIECVGTSYRGAAGSLSNAQIASLVLRTAQACAEYRLTADSQHILRHAHFDSCERANCPGFAQSEMVAWIDAVAQVARAWRGW